MFLLLLLPIALAYWEARPDTTWQWQLSGAIDSSFQVDVYDVDLFDVSAETIQNLHDAAHKVICYFSAGTFEDWRPDAADFPSWVIREPMEEWEGETWLDISNLTALEPIMRARIDIGVSKGCDALEPDNVDAFQNGVTAFGGQPLSYADQLAYNQWIADECHSKDLGVGLKNDLDQIADLIDWFDFAVNEQCNLYDECNTLRPFVDANKAVFGVEYKEEGLDPCEYCGVMVDEHFSWLQKDYDLKAKPFLSCNDYAERDCDGRVCGVCEEPFPWWIVGVSVGAGCLLVASGLVVFILKRRQRKMIPNRV